MEYGKYTTLLLENNWPEWVDPVQRHCVHVCTGAQPRRVLGKRVSSQYPSPYVADDTRLGNIFQVV